MPLHEVIGVVGLFALFEDDLAGVEMFGWHGGWGGSLKTPSRMVKLRVELFHNSRTTSPRTRQSLR